MHRNEVTLVGRLSRAPRGKELPSGDLMTMWGVAVRRPLDHASGKKADGIACVTFDPEVSARVAGWRVDDVISVEGALHQRYRGGPGGGASTYEVEVHRASRLEPGRLSLAADKPPKQPTRQPETTSQQPATTIDPIERPAMRAEPPHGPVEGLGVQVEPPREPVEDLVVRARPPHDPGREPCHAG
ncbi:single-stranded DNA-binding protein [Sphaerisporangium sp. NPDC088356]|uniref:single-stranded DNA-binding protein n=1 Tax=Sphaerisporangium sp. NPDC088356 TaxID=3154871 RepID=UPI003424E3E3